jgi:tRNA modification GTPase
MPGFRTANIQRVGEIQGQKLGMVMQKQKLCHERTSSRSPIAARLSPMLRQRAVALYYPRFAMTSPLEDTIAAISTPIGEGGIAIVRISGKNALEIADRIVRARKGKPSVWESHTIHLAEVGNNGTMLDEVMVSVMRAPKSYTGEDVVEINCHGGILAARRLLDLTLRSGARLAEPGEFTKRAFLNGRMDLTQAEAVIDIIRSGSDRALSAAVQQLHGRLSQKLEPARSGLIEILAHVEAHLDFPDEDIAPEKRASLLEKCVAIEKILRELQATAREGKILREGVRVAIVGRPNVGKSSLLNALLGEERAIVTPIAGTTRDTVEEVVNIRGIPIRLVDTAGLRHTTEHVEQEGIRRSRRAIEQADVIIQVIDGMQDISQEDEDHFRLLGDKPTIIVINKSDLPQLISPSKIPNAQFTVRVSAKTGDGIENLKDALQSIIWGGKVGTVSSEVVINSRHDDLIRRALLALAKAQEGFEKNGNSEFIAVDLRAALDAVGEITGHVSTEDVLDKIFSTFCIGK